MSKLKIVFILASVAAGANIVLQSPFIKAQDRLVNTDLVGKNTDKRDTTSIDSVFLSLISMIELSEVNSQTESTDSLILSTLEFLSSVYEDSDFYTTDNGSTPVADVINTSQFTAYSGSLPSYFHTNFHCPIPLCKITSPFGLRADGTKMHKGIDLSLHRGDTIVAALPGKVQKVGYEKNGYGYFVIIEHPDGYQTRYAHLQKPITKNDAEVYSGMPIAIGGTSGNSSGPHLHFEIRHNNQPVDPTILLKKGWSNGDKTKQSNTQKRDNR